VNEPKKTQLALQFCWATKTVHLPTASGTTSVCKAGYCALIQAVRISTVEPNARIEPEWCASLSSGWIVQTGRNPKSGYFRVDGQPLCAGINRQVVGVQVPAGKEIAQSILTSSLAWHIARCVV
jgi:hypothetical protein